MFVGWQWRDLRRAREHTRKQREAEGLKKASKTQVEAPQEPHER